jgi:hypothetical protein
MAQLMKVGVGCSHIFSAVFLIGIVGLIAVPNIAKSGNLDLSDTIVEEVGKIKSEQSVNAMVDRADDLEELISHSNANDISPAAIRAVTTLLDHRLLNVVVRAATILADIGPLASQAVPDLERAFKRVACPVVPAPATPAIVYALTMIQKAPPGSEYKLAEAEIFADLLRRSGVYPGATPLPGLECLAYEPGMLFLVNRNWDGNIVRPTRRMYPRY